ncbi:unnamed protein product [Eruca vesicaria subsp. sativa]|uniref:Uncharacterized protein n=1 Tax=Eruca vesicaria subsp. sativa TaxID=29727 RepID=A0ABC8L060_ERUVS|nr:unnamed protein product [Eruca vesicaria subsp. sativa]
MNGTASSSIRRKSGAAPTPPEVHLLRFWEVRNVRKDGELMSLDMLLIDENSTVIQDSVNANCQFMFRQHLSEGPVYKLSEFDVTRSDPNFRM